MKQGGDGLALGLNRLCLLRGIGVEVHIEVEVEDANSLTFGFRAGGSFSGLNLQSLAFFARLLDIIFLGLILSRDDFLVSTLKAIEAVGDVEAACAQS